LIVPLASRFVNVPAAALAPPMVAPSIVPPLMSVVVKTDEATVSTPVLLAIVADAVPSLALMFVTSRLVVSTVVALTVPVNVGLASGALVPNCVWIAARSSAATDTYTTAAPVRLNRAPVELSPNVRDNVVPVAV